MVATLNKLTKLGCMLGTVLGAVAIGATGASAQIPIPFGLDKVLGINQNPERPIIIEPTLKVMEESLKGNNVQVCVAPCRPLDFPTNPSASRPLPPLPVIQDVPPSPVGQPFPGSPPFNPGQPALGPR